MYTKFKFTVEPMVHDAKSRKSAIFVISDLYKNLHNPCFRPYKFSFNVFSDFNPITNH